MGRGFSNFPINEVNKLEVSSKKENLYCSQRVVTSENS